MIGKPKVYILVLNYNGWKDTIECVESLFKLDYSNVHIVIIDNASSDSSLAHIKDWAAGKHIISTNNPYYKKYTEPFINKPFPYHFVSVENPGTVDTNQIKLSIIESKTNNGYAAGNNIGITYALAQGDASYIWVLNNDTIVPPHALSYQIEQFESEHKKGYKTGVIGSKLLLYHQPTHIQHMGVKYQPAFAYAKIVGQNQEDQGIENGTNHDFDQLGGASLLMSAPFIDDVGLLSEEYFLYMEEADLAVRAKNKGWKLSYCYQSKIYHKEGASINQNDQQIKSALSEYYWIRSKVLLTLKHYTWHIFTVLLACMAAIVFKLIKYKSFKRLPVYLHAIQSAFRQYKGEDTVKSYHKKYL